MKSPWVSRELYELLERHCASEHENAQMLRRENADLLGKYHQLKLQGFASPGPVQPIDPPAVDPVMQAVNSATAGRDAKVRAMALRQVATDRQAELSDEEIIMRIQRGNRVEEEFI